MPSSFGEMVKDSTRGSLVLLIGQVITTAISAITIIWIATVIGDVSYGEYTVALVPASLLLLFQDLGMSYALMRYCAIYRHENRSGLKSIVYTGLLFGGLTSTILSLTLFIFAAPLSELYLQRPEVTTLVQAASLSILGQGLLSTIQAILIGYELMELRSLTQIIYTVVRGIVGAWLILIGLGNFGAIASYSIALTIASLTSLIILFKFIRFNEKDEGPSLSMLKMLLVYGFPLSAGTILGGALQQIYNSLMVLYASNNAIGNYAVATNFGVLITFITVPLTTSMFPLFSKFKREDPQLEVLFKSTVKYAAIITLPIVLIVIALATQISHVIFAMSYPLVPTYLSILFLNYAFEGLGGITLGNLISGLGESRVLLKANVIVFIVGVILALILIPSFQIIGLLIALISAPRVGWLYQTIWTRKNLGFNVDWSATARLYIAGLTAFLATYLLVKVPNLDGWTALLIGGATYLIVYVITLPLYGALTKKDIEQLQAVSVGLGPLTKVIHIILSIMSNFIRRK